MKDRLENFLHVEVCAGHIAVQDAQKAIASDWVAAYRGYTSRELAGTLAYLTASLNDRL